jgi:hypothetical protein
MNIARLRELCDAFDNGSINQEHHPEQLRELVGLAREAGRKLRYPTVDEVIERFSCGAPCADDVETVISIVRDFQQPKRYKRK